MVTASLRQLERDDRASTDVRPVIYPPPDELWRLDPERASQMAREWTNAPLYQVAFRVRVDLDGRSA